MFCNQKTYVFKSKHLCFSFQIRKYFLQPQKVLSRAYALTLFHSLYTDKYRLPVAAGYDVRQPTGGRDLRH